MRSEGSEIELMGLTLSLSRVRFTYDILVDSAIQLHPVDGEAESFELMSVDKVLDLMKQGKFKPNCSLGGYNLATSYTPDTH
jgi:hypothetical protein